MVRLVLRPDGEGARQGRVQGPAHPAVLARDDHGKESSVPDEEGRGQAAAHQGVQEVPAILQARRYKEHGAQVSVSGAAGNPKGDAPRSTCQGPRNHEQVHHVHGGERALPPRDWLRPAQPTGEPPSTAHTFSSSHSMPNSVPPLPRSWFW